MDSKPSPRPASRSGHPFNLRHLRHSQDPRDQGVAGPASPFPNAVHPSYSSWANQVERWFGRLTDDMIRCGAHKNVQALEADIRAWVGNWNADPKPFIWTKTAQQILESIGRLCQRISGAGH
jgi:hypothetical protein